MSRIDKQRQKGAKTEEREWGITANTHVKFLSGCWECPNINLWGFHAAAAAAKSL